MKIYYLFIISLFLSLPAYGQYDKIQNEGLEVYYRIYGEGQPLLIIGGGPGDNSDRYVSLCEVLSGNFKCILVDQRGTGKSTPEKLDSSTISIDLTLKDFEALRKHLSFEKWNVLGFSYGGYLASLYSQFYPESFSSLVLLGSMGLNRGAFGYFFDNVMSRMLPHDLELLEFWSDSVRVAENPHKATVEQIRAIMSGYFYDKEKSLIISQAIKSNDFNFEMGKWIWRDIGERKLDLSEMIPAYKGKVLILHGRQDPLGELVAFNVSEYFPQTKLVFIEKAGHYSWIEQPGIILKEINSFIYK